MSRRARLDIAVLALAAGLLLTPAAVAAPETTRSLPSAKKEWIALETVNFQLVSEAGERKTSEIALSLERFRRVLARLRPGLALESPVPTTIVAFENDRSFRPYKDRRIQSREDMLGFFLSHRHGNFIALNAFPNNANSLRVVFHEYVHFFVRHNFPQLPLWANEGLAEYYSSFEELSGEVQLGVPLLAHVNLLKRRTFIPFAELFAINETSSEYNEAEKQTLFYAESWALMHYLLSDRASRPGAATPFLKRLSAGEDPERAAREALGVSLAELEDRLRGYINGGKFPFTSIAVGELEAPTRYQVRRLAYEEVLFHLGNLLAHGVTVEQLAEAEEHFRAGIAANPRFAESYAGLGFVARERGDLEEAERQLASAVALGSKRPETQVLLADVLLEHLRRTSDSLSGSSSPDWRRARALLTQALAAEPSFAEAESLLGSTYFYDPEGAAPGIPHLERALALLPDRADIAHNLVLLTLMSGQPEKARALVKSELEARGRLDLAASTLESIDRLALTTASNEAAAQGDGERAVELLRQAAARTADPKLRASLQAQLVTLEKQTERNRQIERFNHAVELANSGQVKAAVRALESLLPELAEGDLRDQARRLIAELSNSRR